MAKYTVETFITDGALTPGTHVSGVSVGRRKNGRVAFRSTWDGTYVGIQYPDPTDPWLNADGTPADDQGEPIFLFKDGHINGHPQATHGFPVERLVDKES